MDVRYFFTARYAEQARDGTLTVVGASTNVIQVAMLPHFASNFFIVGCLAIDREEARTAHTAFVRFTAPDGDLIFQSDEMTSLAGELPPNREFIQMTLVINFKNMLYQSQGLYKFELVVDGEPMKSTSLLLELKSVHEAQSDRMEGVGS